MAGSVLRKRAGRGQVLSRNSGLALRSAGCLRALGGEGGCLGGVGPAGRLRPRWPERVAPMFTRATPGPTGAPGPPVTAATPTMAQSQAAA